ncbi:hypothetical protein FIBSPDRAFT_561886 [Athelia psychrophila]|uniref:Uncharacterized protein n=1 Tax=Athelia psychrophila TaxID=1759441 RepID=A0A166I2B5_9AGAM|nr:hypothetical protein FIBSPDRAFT_561886 [Fibularhizoctonia sp. CBS 109695]
MTDSQVYARRLLPKKHRYPMYYPEPLDNLPLEYRRRGVGIGDVGIIKPDGSFEFAFNIFIPWAESDREINCFGVPDGFVPMQLGRQPVASNQNKHAEGSVIMSNCEKSKDASGSIGVGDGFAPSAPAGTIGFDITSSSSETAVLTVPDGALGEDYYNKKAIRKFAITHALSWYEFINVELGREAPNGSLYVVTGCDRSTAWGIATVEKYSSSGSLSLQFTAIKGQLSASYSCSWSTTPGAVSRHSIAAEDFALGPDVKQPQNQCLFVRGYKVMVREGLMALQSPSELVAAESITDHSKSDSLLRQKDRSFPGTASGSKSWLSRIAGYQGGGKSNRESADGWSAEKELDPHVGAYHPLDSINSYLLDQTQAQIAITHESDWWALSPDETTPNESEIISRLATHYALSIESGGAFLTPIPNERSNAQSNDGSAIVLETGN